VLEEIRSQADINFIYSDKLVDNLKVTIRTENTPAKNAIHKILSKHNISSRIFNKNSYVLYKEASPKESYYKAVIIKQDNPNIDTTHIIIEPKIISKMEPAYPPNAIENEIEGNVMVNLFVTKDGEVSRAVVKLSSGSSTLDSAAVDYSYQLKFSPAQDNGKPRSMWVSMMYKYYFSK
jgi:TonB family protein